MIKALIELHESSKRDERFLIMPFGDFHDRTYNSSVSAPLRTREITMLSLSKSPSNFHVDEVRSKEYRKKKDEEENEEAKIEGMNMDKRTERKCHTETEYALLLMDSETVMPGKTQFSLCDL